MKPTKNNTFQIIAGQYRGRKFSFPNAVGLRPTPNKVRETLFNWLQFENHNKTYLDLFAGSGALSFEALSRGASSVVSIEKDTQAWQSIQENTQILHTDKLQVLNLDALEFLKQNTQTFDFILLDPPFNKNMIKTVLDLLNQSITTRSKIYIESELKITDNICSMPIKIIKQKQTSNVHYALIQLK